MRTLPQNHRARGRCKPRYRFAPWTKSDLRAGRRVSRYRSPSQRKLRPRPGSARPGGADAVRVRQRRRGLHADLGDAAEVGAAVAYAYLAATGVRCVCLALVAGTDMRRAGLRFASWTHEHRRDVMRRSFLGGPRLKVHFPAIGLPFRERYS